MPPRTDRAAWHFHTPDELRAIHADALPTAEKRTIRAQLGWRSECNGASLAMASSQITGYPMSVRPTPTGRPATWRDSLGRQPTRGTCFEPRTRDELFAIIGEAARTSTLIRAVGAGHSTSGAAKPEGAWLDLRALRRTLPLAGLRAGVHPSSYLRIEAGIVLDDLQKLLVGRGMALAGTNAFGKQTLAGAIATATHGSSMAHGSLADSVASVELVVLGSDRGRLVPRVVRLEPSDGITDPKRFATASDRDTPMELLQDDELFYGAVVGLGAAGIACAYTLALKPFEALEERSFRVSWANLSEALADLAMAHAFVDVTLYPHPTGAQSSGLTRDEAISCLVTTRNPAQKHEPQTFDADATNVSAPLTPSQSPPSRPGAAPSRSSLGAWGRTSAMELSVPLEDASRAVAALLDEAEAMRRDGFTHSGPFTLRFAAPSRHALSMNAGRATCSIELALLAGTPKSGAAAEAARANDDPRTMVHRVQDALETLVPSARPHWGMPHEMDAVALTARYPDASAWRRACRAFDPRGCFLNTMTRALLFSGNLSSLPPRNDAE